MAEGILPNAVEHLLSKTSPINPNCIYSKKEHDDDVAMPTRAKRRLVVERMGGLDPPAGGCLRALGWRPCG